MQPYVMSSDLYRFKLALVVGRGKRLKKIMRKYPTEKKFKNASSDDIIKLIGARNQPDLLDKLFSLDSLYDELVTFKANPNWSKRPLARKIMAIDTEYYKSKLDLIQFVVQENNQIIDSGIIFTNEDIAPALSPEAGITKLREIIAAHQPEVLVGHNFNSDVVVLESALGKRIPELYFYDDTMDLMYYSNLANILGCAGLNDTVNKLFAHQAPDLDTAYSKPAFLVHYGLQDALFTLLIREYIMYGDFSRTEFDFEINQIIKAESEELFDNRIRLSLLNKGGLIDG
ncbi:hypothetical protein [Halanaerobium salsuginis]|jgi:hypothetical protein|uniref:3'-5' exonuclease n=1 Tax=Halanaerobium salsuginis TaxID=29563 RepID=A0A1I4I5Y9_9FIRM|nr:hypothetical protein [Halanaerobium salsuginis]SFL49828.1 hypothetical protein SAMN02983006_01309 [Halanaerobium salsuginis]